MSLPGVCSFPPCWSLIFDCWTWPCRIGWFAKVEFRLISSVLKWVDGISSWKFLLHRWDFLAAKDPVPNGDFQPDCPGLCPIFSSFSKNFYNCLFIWFDIWCLCVDIFIARHWQRIYVDAIWVDIMAMSPIANDFLGPLWSCSHSYCREIQVGQIWTKVAQFLCRTKKYILRGTNISPPKVLVKMLFLFPRWDMLVDWRVLPIKNDKHKLYVQSWDTSPPPVALKNEGVFPGFPTNNVMILLVTVTGWEGTSQVILSIEEMLLNTWDVM